MFGFSKEFTGDADVFLYIISFYKLVRKQKSENIEFIVGCCEWRLEIVIDNTTRTPLGHQAVAEGNVDLIKIDETRSELSYTFNAQLRYSSVVADLHVGVMVSGCNVVYLFPEYEMYKSNYLLIPFFVRNILEFRLQPEVSVH